jgi:cytochrome c-type biogenesis protein CcmE
MSAKPRKNLAKIVLGVVGVVAGLGGLMAVALGGSTVSTVPFAEVPKQREKVSVFGVLDKQSIRSIRGANVVAFDLLEEVTEGDKKRLTGARLPVLYQNNAVGLPANFPAASHARAAGMYDPVNKKLVSDQVYTKCPSKYEENGLDPATKEALKTWKESIGEGKETAAASSGPTSPASGITTNSRPL